MIVCFKLVNGEEIIGEVLSTEQHLYVIQNVLNVHLEPRENDKIDVVLVKQTPHHKDQPFTLLDHAVMYVVEPSDDLLELYNRRFSKIVVPQSQQIIV